MSGRVDVVLGRLQWWLQGHENRWRPWFLVRIGNAISDYRFWQWERSGGTHAVEWEEALREIGTASTNLPHRWKL